MAISVYEPKPFARQSHALWDRARAVSPMGAQGDGKYYSPHPHFISRAKGARLWDADGQTFIDYWNGAGPCVLGHGDAAVSQAVARAEAERGVLYSAPHELEIELCETLAQIIPCAEMSALLTPGPTSSVWHCG